MLSFGRFLKGMGGALECFATGPIRRCDRDAGPRPRRQHPAFLLCGFEKDGFACFYSYSTVESGESLSQRPTGGKGESGRKGYEKETQEALEAINNEITKPDPDSLYK